MAVLAAGCGAQPLFARPDTPRYQVTASLMQKPGGPATACWAMRAPLPPIGCGGVPVLGVGINTLPGAHQYSNGVWATATLHLVGTWSPGGLTPTEAPRASSSGVAWSPPACTGDLPATPGAQARMNLLGRDTPELQKRGVFVLQYGPCGDVLQVLVGVADRAAVTELDRAYGPVHVSGWLQPA